MHSSIQVVTPMILTPNFVAGQMPFLSPNQQSQNTEGRKHHIPWTCSAQPHLGSSILIMTIKGYLEECQASHQPFGTSTPAKYIMVSIITNIYSRLKHDEYLPQYRSRCTRLLISCATQSRHTHTHTHLMNVIAIKQQIHNQFKTHCNSDSHSSKIANIILS